ncbi:hypothetical protein SRCM100623_03033 [Acetobacter pasteurianus]|uniref:Uncharacterized protein n=1 Tax=Acetobacter pasteurianus TaxID=438 RepID=A0A1A0C593_ACEPA|nr:hypothetical protein [Acetobacter pasteurianus]OAZ58169.1 hypothetical protein SRCM100623_03033 [Acetobacter pasteurianus]
MIGYHATSKLNSADIETNGFRPLKIVSDHDHCLLQAALKRNNVSATISGSYTAWMNLRSVTFTADKRAAVEHILKGAASGQGASNIEKLLLYIHDDQSLVDSIASKLNQIKASEKVIYKIDLSNLGPTFTQCPLRTNIYYYRWNPTLAPEACSGLPSGKILAKYLIKYDGTVEVFSGLTSPKPKICRYEMKIVK